MLDLDLIKQLHNDQLSVDERIILLKKLSSTLQLPAQRTPKPATPKRSLAYTLLLCLNILISSLYASGDILIGSSTLLSFLPLANLTIFIISIAFTALFLATFILFQCYALAKTLQIKWSAVPSAIQLYKEEHTLLLKLAEQVGSEAFYTAHPTITSPDIEAFQAMLTHRLHHLKTIADKLKTEQKGLGLQIARGLVLAFCVLWQLAAGFLIGYYALLTIVILLNLVIPAWIMIVGSLLLGAGTCMVFLVEEAADYCELVARWFSCDQASIDLLSEETLPESSASSLSFLSRLAKQTAAQPPQPAPYSGAAHNGVFQAAQQAPQRSPSSPQQNAA